MGLTGLSGLSGISGAFGGSEWTPLSLGSSLVLWLSAEDVGGSDGSVISAWVSREGNSYLFHQNNLSKQPVLKTGANGINGYSVVRFDGSDDLLAYNGTLTTATDGVVVALIRLSSGFAAYQTVLASCDVGASTRYFALRAYEDIDPRFAISIAQRDNDTAEDMYGNSEVTSDVPYVMSWISTGTEYRMRHNGVEQSVNIQAGANNGDWFGDTTQRDTVTLGALQRNTEAQFLKGDICELVICAPNISSADLSRLEQYMSERGDVVLGGWELASGAEGASGSWCWFAQPRAVVSGGKTYAGWATPTGKVVYSAIEAGESPSSPYVLHDFSAPDDHMNPAFFVRADGTLFAFYSDHSGGALYIMESVRPYEGVWLKEIDLDSQLEEANYTYPHPIQLTGETNDPIYLFYRSADSGTSGEGCHFSTSEDGGVTWATSQALLTNGDERPYFVVAQNGDDRIDIAINDGHPTSVTTNCTYHGYITGGNLYKSDGTLVGAIGSGPYSPSDLTLVYDGTTYRSWVWDIAIDDSGYPVIAYADFVSTTDHRYRYARWTGSAWDDHEIVAAGGTIYPVAGSQDYYSGGISIDRADTSIVYLSREVSGVHEVYKYTTSDGGTNWSAVAITSGSENGNYRPFVPYNAIEDSPMFYMAGVYTTYEDFATEITAYLP